MIELRSKCHGAPVKEVHTHDPIAVEGGLESYYECRECGTMCEISLVNQDFDLDEEARSLFAWSASPRTISECEDYLKALMSKLKGE